MKRLLMTLTFLIIIPIQTIASDGVLEINQTCAIELGCFTGDSAGFPVTINALDGLGRSYKLTSDLSISSTTTNVIDVLTSNVTIDLNGFSITAFACTNTDSDCTPASQGSGSGISSANTRNNITVKNGSIIGMGYNGVKLEGLQSHIENITSKWNYSYGALLGKNAIVSNNRIFENGTDGIKAKESSFINNNHIKDNGGDGVNVLNDSSIIKNIVVSNTGDGIETTSGSLVKDNVVNRNSAYGLKLSTTSAYSNNMIYLNSLSVFLGVEIGTNFCDGDTTCP